ncbi:8442_t:CDS:2 [Racocetra fulgida]|uniref:8442_t:CDS:1 n=1 Tax=Racocetra fulgida TaxID=60492 RepID=A0A9N9CQS0_9GLOM|nr:8442_t:CDS:2 [Racocetra fulgida]
MSSNAIISTIKAYIDQSMAAQMDLINKMNERLDLFNQQQNSDLQSNPTQQGSGPSHNHDFDLTSLQQADNQNKDISTQQCNCPLTPLLNNLLINFGTTSPQNITGSDEIELKLQDDKMITKEISQQPLQQ